MAPRIRTIKPEFPQSESMGRVSRDARLLFVLLWTICDDCGRTRGASRMLASLLFPYDDDAPYKIDNWIDELEREGCIVRYSVEGNTYIEVRNWLQHQRIDRPTASKIPPCVEPSRALASPREPSCLDLDRDLDRDREKDQDQDIICGETKTSSPPTATPPDQPSAKKPKRPPEPADDSPIVMTFDCDGEPRQWHLTQRTVTEWSGLFPSLDILREARAALAWVKANPANRKTHSGMKRFLVAWLTRTQNRGPGARGASASTSQPPRPLSISELAPEASRELTQEELDAKLAAARGGKTHGKS